MKSVTTFLMFAGKQHGNAKSAIDFYTSIFPESHVDHIEFYQEGEVEPVGTVKGSVFTLKEHKFMAMDSSQPYSFSFTPSVSLFVECETEEEVEKLFNTLSDSGEVLMPLGYYGFSRMFAWVNDRFGISWQLNLAA